MEDTFATQEATRKSRRWGCTCGCALFVVGLLFLAVSLGVYLFRPISPTPRERWIAQGTNGFGTLRLNPEDSGISDLITLGIKRLEEIEQQTQPKGETAPAKLSFGVIRSVLGQFIYPEMLIYLENEPATGKENALFVVQMKNRFSRVLLGAIPTSVPDLEVQRLPGADLYAGKAPDGKEGKSVALSGRSLMFSSNQAFARQAIEREEKEHQGEPSEKMQQMLDNLVQDKPESGEDLTLVLTNDGSRLETWITEAEKTLGSSGLGELLVQGMAEKKMAASDILAVRLGMDLTSVDRAKVSISFFCRQAEIARKFSDVAKSLAARVLQAGENRVLTVTKSDVRVRGSSVLVELEISGLKKIIDQVLPAAAPAKSAEKTPAVAPGV